MYCSRMLASCVYVFVCLAQNWAYVTEFRLILKWLRKIIITYDMCHIHVRTYFRLSEAEDVICEYAFLWFQMNIRNFISVVFLRSVTITFFLLLLLILYNKKTAYVHECWWCFQWKWVWIHKMLWSRTIFVSFQFVSCILIEFFLFAVENSYINQILNNQLLNQVDALVCVQCNTVHATWFWWQQQPCTNICHSNEDDIISTFFSTRVRHRNCAWKENHT